MSLRLKLVLALVALSAAATAAIGLFSYRTTADQLRQQVDRSLVEAAQRLDSGPERFPRGGPERNRFRGEGDVVVQFVTATGLSAPFQGGALPVEEIDRRIAAAQGATSLMRDVEVDSEPYRMLTSGAGDGAGAVQTARSLAETERVLSGLRSNIALAAMLVVLGAIALGSLIARQVTRRLVRLTAAAEEVTATRQLDVTVPVSGGDETGRLGTAFNEMLAALARSERDQQRLVQDAGHELRTPLTSLRTNVYALRRAEQLSAAQRAQLVADLEGEAEELTRLVNEVVELATDGRDDEPLGLLDLGALVERVTARAAQRTGREVRVDADHTLVTGQPLALERAVGNLVENAVKFDDRGPIAVTCAAGRVEVVDNGPGIDDTDLPRVFDRFYRATTARSRPGSGLGLSIVADVVDRHGGTVFAHAAAHGGAVVGFALPPATADTDAHTLP